MFEAQYLFGGNEVYSPWMSRGGDNMTITADLISKDTSNLEVALYEKNSEDTGDGTAHSGGTLMVTDASGGTPSSKTYTGVKELVRYRIEATGSGTNRVLYRMLTPVWFDAVGATGV